MAFLLYLLQINIALSLLYLCYKVLFSQNTFFGLRRLILISIVLFSTTYPWYDIPDIDPIIPAHLQITLPEVLYSIGETVPQKAFDIYPLIAYLYGGICSLFLLRMFLRIASIIKLRANGKLRIIGESHIIVCDENIQPCSFFRWIFLPHSILQNMLTAEVRSSVRVMVVLLGAVLLYGVAEGSFQAAGHPLMANFTPLAFVLVITMTAAGDVQTMIGSGTETMEQLDVLGKALLPTLAAAVAASGGIVSASARQVATVFFSNLLLTLIRNVLLPLVYFYVASAAAGAMLPGEPLKRIAAGIKKVVTWALTGSLVLFTGYLTLTGAASTSADALVLQMTRSVISTAVPVVGGIISQASGSVLSGAGLLKNSLGVFGMLAVLATCLTPFLHMAVQYLLYKVTAFLAGTAGNGTLVELIDALGSAFGLVLGMVGSCALLLLISITSSVSVVVS